MNRTKKKLLGSAAYFCAVAGIVSAIVCAATLIHRLSDGRSYGALTSGLYVAAAMLLCILLAYFRKNYAARCYESAGETRLFTAITLMAEASVLQLVNLSDLGTFTGQMLLFAAAAGFFGYGATVLGAFLGDGIRWLTRLGQALLAAMAVVLLLLGAGRAYVALSYPDYIIATGLAAHLSGVIMSVATAVAVGCYSELHMMGEEEDGDLCRTFAFDFEAYEARKREQEKAMWERYDTVEAELTALRSRYLADEITEKEYREMRWEIISKI